MEIEQLLKVVKLLEGKKEKSVFEEKCECHDIKIAILQRGWVMVGRFGQEGSNCYLEDAAVIRSWGTTKGIGEIALNGPIADKTVLDKCGDVKFHELTAVAILDCNQDKWRKALK